MVLKHGYHVFEGIPGLSTTNKLLLAETPGHPHLTTLGIDCRLPGTAVTRLGCAEANKHIDKDALKRRNPELE